MGDILGVEAMCPMKLGSYSLTDTGRQGLLFLNDYISKRYPQVLGYKMITSLGVEEQFKSILK